MSSPSYASPVVSAVSFEAAVADAFREEVEKDRKASGKPAPKMERELDLLKGVVARLDEERRLHEQENKLVLAGDPKQEGGKRRGPFVPPSAGEVTAYSAEIEWPLDGDAFCATYETKGWCTSGSTKMRDWKAAVRKWKGMGWKTGSRTNGHEGAGAASLGSLQVQLSKVEQQMEEILYKGGSAYKTTPTGAELERFNRLADQRKSLKDRISKF